jgi:hypothetical protein
MYEWMLQVGFDAFPFIFGLFLVFVVVIIAVAFARAMSMRGRVQRPFSETTAFPPPPPPDTVMVKCEYCGTQQTWRETCVQCGAPLPKPRVG